MKTFSTMIRKRDIYAPPLQEMGYTQLEIPIQTNNYNACGVANNAVHPKLSKATDMRFYWVQDKIKQDYLNVFWKPGMTNLADNFTKHHLLQHSREMHPIYLYIEPTAEKYSMRMCSLITEISHISNNNTRAVTK